MKSEEDRLSELRNLGPRYAKAKADRVYFDHYRKSKLAILAAVILEEKDCAHNRAESEARIHPEYLQVLEALRDATEIEEKLRWELKIAEAGIEVWKEKQYNQRAEMRLT